jgi:hypothetical protein
MTTTDRPALVNTNIHAPEGIRFKVGFRQSSANWIFDLVIGTFNDCIFIHPNDLRRFVTTLQTAIDQLDLPHDEPEEATQ